MNNFPILQAHLIFMFTCVLSFYSLVAPVDESMLHAAAFVDQEKLV